MIYLTSHHIYSTRIDQMKFSKGHEARAQAYAENMTNTKHSLEIKIKPRSNSNANITKIQRFLIFIKTYYQLITEYKPYNHHS